MSKHIEKLKKQLLEISEVVNAFKSEAVQVKIVDRLLDAMLEVEKTDGENPEMVMRKGYKPRNGEDIYSYGRGPKKPGATKIWNQLLNTDFFDTARSISS